MDTFYLKFRDTRPILEVELTDPDGTVHDLTGATSAKVHIKLASGAVLDKALVMDVDLTLGIVRYTWLSTDWAAGGLVEGTHTMEYEVQGPSTARLTFPNDGDHVLVIHPDIGQAT